MSFWVYSAQTIKSIPWIHVHTHTHTQDGESIILSDVCLTLMGKSDDYSEKKHSSKQYIQLLKTSFYIFFRKLKCRTATNGVQIRELRNHLDMLIKCRFWFVQCRRGWWYTHNPRATLMLLACRPHSDWQGSRGSHLLLSPPGSSSPIPSPHPWSQFMTFLRRGENPRHQ